MAVYWKGIRKFEARSFDDCDESAAYADATYVPPMEVLRAWQQPAISREGAIAALRLVVKEEDDFWANDVHGAMVKAALGYLEREGGAS